METISVAINDSSDVLCSDLYLIKIFAKSTNTERCIKTKGESETLKVKLYRLSVTVADLNLYRRYR